MIQGRRKSLCLLIDPMAMQIYPNQLPEQIDFPFLRYRLLDYCISRSARELVAALQPENDFEWVDKALTETDEMLRIIQRGEYLIPNAYPDIQKEIQLLSVDQSVLSVHQVFNIRIVLKLTHHIQQYFQDKAEIYPQLYHRVRVTNFDLPLTEWIDEIIHEDGYVMDEASARLREIRIILKANRQHSDRLYRAQINRLNKLGQLADIQEGFIQGRRVLAVLPEYKREVKGIILGQSASGSIVFIEPQNVIEINNERIDLEDQEKQEIVRIMRELCERMRPFRTDLIACDSFVSCIDFITAKARLAADMKGKRPRLVSEPGTLQLIQAYHPVLWIQHTLQGLPIEPIQCTFSNSQRIMVVSGPNAGGKSITLKTIGLLQFMIQCGLLIPASERSEFCIKNKLLGDIGDQQSITDGLSTYSSRLTKMKYFLQHADEHTLFLIDEFGTGSDPEMGGALAEVILDKLNALGAAGVVTTHFTNLKILANDKEGIFNACMLFNQKTLKPLYQLHIGEPGSSFTFEVAEKIGLPAPFIQEAKAKLTSEKVYLDTLLNRLQTEKNTLAKLRKDLQKQLSKTTQEKREFQAMTEKMTEEFFQEQKNRLQQQRFVEWGKKMEQFMREWEAGAGRKEVINRFIRLVGYEQFKRREQEAYEKTEKYRQEKLKRLKGKVTQGTRVRLLKSREIGIVKLVKDDRVEVLFGNVIMNIGLEKLEIVIPESDSQLGKLRDSGKVK